jgi:hypothetical protein
MASTGCPHRIALPHIAFDRVAFPTTAPCVGQRHASRLRLEVEQPVFQHAGDILIEPHIGKATCGQEVPPHRMTLHYRPGHQEAGQMDLSRSEGHRGSPQSWCNSKFYYYTVLYKAIAI